MKTLVFKFCIVLIFIFSDVFSQTTVFEDPLIGSTEHGTMVGGFFTTEGYRPNKGLGHILYILPYQVTNGYLEFQIKGFSPDLIDDPEQDADNGFFGMYDGRGITEPILYFDDFKTNFFRWNFHYRQGRSVFKSVIQCAAPTPERLNATKAVFGYTNEGLIDKDWGEEPNGINYVTNTTSWYTVRAEWKDKEFTISINGTVIWEASGPYDYAPIDHRIWIGCAPGVGDKYVNLVSGLTYRNVKVVSYDNLIPPDTLVILPNELNVDYTSGSSSIDITSNTDWSITYMDSWISASQSSSNGDTSLNINYDQNDSNDPRVGIVEFSTENIMDTIIINQDGKPLQYIDISPDTVNVDFISGEIQFIVEANVGWSANSNDDWISVDRKGISNNDTLIISYLQNNSSNPRIAEIVVSNDSMSSSCYVAQSGSNAYINISKRTWEVSKNSGSVSFFIESNLPWHLTSKATWLTTSIQDTSGDASFMANYQANTDTSTRIGIILVENDFFVDSVSVIQAGANPLEIALSANPPGAGTLLGGGIYGENSNVTIRAMANEGWKFDSWTENESLISVDSVFTFKIKSQRNFVANFSILTNVEDFETIPTDFNLAQNYPNPFNPSTTISFGLPEDSFVNLVIYNLLGQEVRNIVSSHFHSGYYSINFDASDLPSGTYIYSISASGIKGNEFVESKKMLLIK